MEVWSLSPEFLEVGFYLKQEHIEGNMSDFMTNISSKMVSWKFSYGKRENVFKNLLMTYFVTCMSVFFCS